MSSPHHPKKIFRFAPSPSGYLHLGHAYSALLNYDLSRKSGGEFFVRMEDIDTERCNREYELRILDDLSWLGIEWTGEVRRQSDYFDDYRRVLSELESRSLVYPSLLSRREIRERVSLSPSWDYDPDGVPHYPGDERDWDSSRRLEAKQGAHSLRLDTARAVESVGTLYFTESGLGPSGETGRIEIFPHRWGDVILGRSDIPASYHLSVVVDDSLQGVTHIVRGVDLFYATYIHRLLQELLGFAVPEYHHHSLIMDSETPKKLSKRDGSMGLLELRRSGKSPSDIRRMVGLPIT